MSYRVSGPVNVLFDEKDIGLLKEGVIIRPRFEWEPIIVDYYGRVPIDFINTGVSAAVECIGVDPSAIATANPWIKDLFAFGNKVGALASAEFSKSLKIQERDGQLWIASNAFLAGMADIPLLATRELAIPLTFIVLPDEDDKLWATLPSYFDSNVGG